MKPSSRRVFDEMKKKIKQAEDKLRLDLQDQIYHGLDNQMEQKISYIYLTENNRTFFISNFEHEPTPGILYREITAEDATRLLKDNHSNFNIMELDKRIENENQSFQGIKGIPYIRGNDSGTWLGFDRSEDNRWKIEKEYNQKTQETVFRVSISQAELDTIGSRVREAIISKIVEKVSDEITQIIMEKEGGDIVDEVKNNKEYQAKARELREFLESPKNRVGGGY